MSIRTNLGRFAAPLALAGVISGCGAAVAATPHAPSQASSPPGQSAPATPQARLMAIARRQYAAEVGGGVAQKTLHRVGSDPALLRALASGNGGAVRAYVQKQFQNVWYHWHVSRMRITKGSRTIVETGVPFVVAPSQMTLRSGGRTLGTLEVSIQDEIGFVRLMHRNHPVDVVVRGSKTGRFRTSLPAAAHVKLPASGPVTIGGRRYRVQSFQQTAWNNDPVTVWILQKG